MLFEKAAFMLLAGPKKVEVLKKKYPDMAEAIDWLSDEDPTGGKQKYLQWATIQLIKEKKEFGMIDLAHLRSMRDLLIDFHKLRKYMPEKDINRYDWRSMMDAIEEAEGESEALEQAKQPDLVHQDGNTKIWEITSKEQMCMVGEGSNWCVANPTGSYYDEYMSKPGAEFYLIEQDGEKYLAFVSNRVVNEVRDWRDSEAQEMGDVIVDAGLAESNDFEDEEERYERLSEEAWRSTHEDLEYSAERIVEYHAEDYFDDFMHDAEEDPEGDYWKEAWDKFQVWGKAKIDEYFREKLENLGGWNSGEDMFGFEDDWDFKWESDYNDSAYGWFTGKREDEVYAAALVKMFLEDEMGWKGSDNPGENDEKYLEPWDELLKQVAARIVGVI